VNLPQTVRRSRAFTLIELILVMAVLLIVFSVAAPQLASFFRGRTLEAEARRFVALARYGQSRAVAEGVPMVLWIDQKQRSYGLEMQAGYSEHDDKAVAFTLGTGLEIEAALPQTATGLESVAAMSVVSANTPMIRFTPDGFIGPSSPENIILREGDQDAVLIGPSRTRLSYEIQTNNLLTARR
jgi:type II secretion system protein H